MTAPPLTSRAAREQRVFRTLLSCMASPGLVGSISSDRSEDRFAAAIALLESLLDHEVTFAVTPAEPGVVGTLLRSTGSRTVPVERADYILAWAGGVESALNEAKVGTYEYPDRNGTVIAIVDDVSTVQTAGTCLTLSGPGIRDTADVWVRGAPSRLADILAERNAGAPIGIDVVLVAPSGFITCIPRYTRVEEFGV